MLSFFSDGDSENSCCPHLPVNRRICPSLFLCSWGLCALVLKTHLVLLVKIMHTRGTARWDLCGSIRCTRGVRGPRFYPENQSSLAAQGAALGGRRRSGWSERNSREGLRQAAKRPAALQLCSLLPSPVALHTTASTRRRLISKQGISLTQQASLPPHSPE